MSTLYYIVVGNEITNVRRSAPLQHVSVSGFLRDTVAEYTLVQTYVNPLQDATIEAAYTFPLYEGVAVSGFEAEVDGRKIVGKVQEKAAARKEYEEAVKEGKVASLLEQAIPDVFQASVGNIPPSKTISIRITLVSEIKQDADENQMRFVLPTAVAPRYGSGPVDIASSGSGSSSSSKLSVDISCAMSKQITSIQSPTHTIQVHLGTSFTRVSLTADSLLDRDLVIVVQALGLDSPRARVERHPKDGTHAVSLTFSPRFALNSLKSSELIFLVDRSGSMGSGSQIKQARAALELFLRSIPLDDHYINIIGFGSSHEALFPNSVEYNAETLKTSTQYAQAMDSDMGGTEMLGAFQEIFERRRRDVPTQIFVLTDGQIWNIDALVQCIKQAVDEGEKTNSFVRVFSLGVGAAVSHHLIESMARAGGGYAQLVVDGERFEKKVMNMLKAALMPPVSNVSIQWTNHTGDEDISDFEMVEAIVEEEESLPAHPKEPISLFSTDAEIPSPPPPPPTVVLPDVVIPIHQAPFKIPALYRGARFSIYAILSSDTPAPTELILRGSSPDGPVELKVSVESVQDGETMLHSLAARTLVRDLDEGTSCIHALAGNATAANEQMLKKLGIHVVKDGKTYRNKLSDSLVSKLAKQKTLELALKYHLSSKYTSWVAIDHDQVVTESLDCYARASGGAPDMLYASGGIPHVRSAKRMIQRMKQCHDDDDATLQSYLLSASPPGEQLPSSISSRSRLTERLRSRTNIPPRGGRGGLMRKQLAAKATRSAKSSLALAFIVDDLAEEEAENLATSYPHARLHSLLQHLQYDGSFPLVPEIAALFSTTVKKLTAKLREFRKDHDFQLSEPEWKTLWATCLAMEFLKKQLPDLHEEWELVEEKARKRVAAMVKDAEGIAALQQAAFAVIA